MDCEARLVSRPNRQATLTDSLQNAPLHVLGEVDDGAEGVVIPGRQPRIAAAVGGVGVGGDEDDVRLVDAGSAPAAGAVAKSGDVHAAEK